MPGIHYVEFLTALNHSQVFGLSPITHQAHRYRQEEDLHQIWEVEDRFIDDYEQAFGQNPEIINALRRVFVV